MRPLSMLCLLALLLSSCHPNLTQQIDFATDPRIFRGAWQGTLSGETSEDVVFDLNATYVDATKYAVTGTAEFGGTIYTLEGEAWGGAYHRYLEPQRAPPPPPGLAADLTDGETRWRLSVRLEPWDGSGDWVYEGSLRHPDDDAFYRGLEMTPRP